MYMATVPTSWWPESGLHENNCDTENKSEEETPTNDKSLDAEENSEPLKHQYSLEGSMVSHRHSLTTCEGLRPKTGQVITYTK